MTLRARFCAFILFLLTALIGACTGGSPTSQTSDGATPESTSGTTSSDDGSSDAENVGDAGALVAQCQALAMQFVANCYNEFFGADGGRTPDTTRVCIWTAYSHLCATGNTNLLIDSMNCFNGNQYCWTFSDCNTACSCLDSLHAAEAPPATLSLLRAQCTACDYTDCASLIGEAEVIPYLADPTIAALAACAGGTCTNADAGVHCSSLIPNVGDFSCN